MALFEVGNCFAHAWGVPGLKKNHPDHAMAAMYYRIGAEMGDKDSQERECNATSRRVGEMLMGVRGCRVGYLAEPGEAWVEEGYVSYFCLAICSHKAEDV